MAGSFFHLWLARQVQADLYPGEVENRGQRSQALMAGALAPDLGFFPGGPQRLSERIHREYSGDFLRALLNQAQGELEEAFVVGWALHLYTDLAIHPWVEDKVRGFWQEGEGKREGYPDLWHMRSEWGIDCKLLERQDLDFLWTAAPRFPQGRDKEPLLVRTGRDFYGEDARGELVHKGAMSVEKWIRRLPRLLLWCGKVRVPGRRGLFLITPWLDRLTERVLGEWLAGCRSWKTEAALAKPWIPTQADLQAVADLGAKALQEFRKGREDGFAPMGNLDLEAGQPADLASGV